MAGDGLIFGVGTLVATTASGDVPFGELQNVSFDQSVTWKTFRGGGSRYATAARVDEIKLSGKAEFGKIDAAALALLTGGTKDATNKVAVTSASVPGTFKLICTNPNDGSARTVTFYKCFSAKLSLAMKQGDFTIPGVDFEVLADETGKVADFEGFTEA